jgi:hypothetical protein
MVYSAVEIAPLSSPAQFPQTRPGHAPGRPFSSDGRRETLIYSLALCLTFDICLLRRKQRTSRFPGGDANHSSGLRRSQTAGALLFARRNAGARERLIHRCCAWRQKARAPPRSLGR